MLSLGETELRLPKEPIVLMHRNSAAIIVLVLISLLIEARVGAAPPSTQEVDRSLSHAVRYLAAQQQPSGAWRAPQGESAAMTSLALMALMANGHVPGEGPHGKNMERAVRWVIDRQFANGLIASNQTHGVMYEHGICTLMLAEVAGMTDEPLASRVRASLASAVKLILQAQAVAKSESHLGGWRYGPSSNDSDLSATGWQLLALRAAKDVGCDVPVASIDAAVSYVKRCAGRSGGFSYQPGDGVTPTRSGTGILCLEVCGQHHAAETMVAAEFLRRRPPRVQDGWFFYGAYYSSIGMFKVGGDYWTETRDSVASALLISQSPDGAWTGQGSNEFSFGPIYCTSLAALALAVEYQYLPIYQR